MSDTHVQMSASGVSQPLKGLTPNDLQTSQLAIATIHALQSHNWTYINNECKSHYNQFNQFTFSVFGTHQESCTANDLPTQHCTTCNDL